MDFHSTACAFPAIKNPIAKAVLAANLGHHSALFLLPWDADDLTFLEPLWLQASFLLKFQVISPKSYLI
jgi:hypothetical protein